MVGWLAFSDSPFLTFPSITRYYGAKEPINEGCDRKGTRGDPVRHSIVQSVTRWRSWELVRHPATSWHVESDDDCRLLGLLVVTFFVVRLYSLPAPARLTVVWRRGYLQARYRTAAGRENVLLTRISRARRILLPSLGIQDG